MQNKKIQKIREALSWGCSEIEACHYAEVSLATLEKYLQQNPQFREEKNRLETLPNVLLKKRLFEAIAEAKPETCLKLLERKEQAGTPEVDFEIIAELEKRLHRKK